MPPAISDDESDPDLPDNIPAREVEDAPMADADEDEDEDEDDEEVYQVEKVVDHKFFKGGMLKYRVKWLGYEDEKDLTWEPVDNMDNAEDAVKAYHLEIGGTPERGSSVKPKNGGKRTAAEAFDSPAPSGSQKKKGGRKSQTNGTSEDWGPPAGSWEDHVVRVAAIIEVEDPAVIKKGKTDIKGLEGLLEWSPQHGDRKTQHKMEQLRKKCPQRLLDYYESHLVFNRDPRYND